MNLHIHNAIKIEYEKRQKEAHDNLEKRKLHAFSMLPELEKIDSMIAFAGIEINKLILKGQKPSDQAVKELDEKIRQLKEKKYHLLDSAGLPQNYLDIRYRCSMCKDTGFIDYAYKPAERCSCYKQLYISLLYESSNLKLAKFENFSNFDDTFYPDIIDEKKYGIKKSPRSHIMGIKEKCIKFIENFESPEEKNLYFCGPTGVGKTFMANCIANELIERCHTVLYLSAPQLFDLIAAHKVNIFKFEDYDEAPYKNLFDVELLIIDDLGTESQSASRYSELLNILNTRQVNNFTRPCKTIVSTNISPENLFKDYTERVESRIIGTFALYKFAGEDIRKLKKLRNAAKASSNDTSTL